MRHYTLPDKLIAGFDVAFRTLNNKAHHAKRNTPAANLPENELTEAEKSHSAGLMRVNHSGEVCAQALYQGQALTAKLPDTRVKMEHAAEEEIDHLAWCEQRLGELNSHTSRLNPLWYGLSFSVGATAGLISDKISLGFVAATEQQVCKHLDEHLDALPAQDKKSQVIVQQMRQDEAQHADAALAAGGARFPTPVKGLMTLVSKVMTKASYRV